MDAENFFNQATDPAFGDSMNLQLVKQDPDPETSFSFEGIDILTDQIHDFILARLSAAWKSTGKPPKSLFANINLKIGEPPVPEEHLEIGLPWSNWRDNGPGVVAIDSSLRWEGHSGRNGLATK